MSAIHLLHQKCIPLPLTYALLIIILHSSIVLAQSCYFPSGALAPSFTPCNGTASASHCCSPSDACLTSSLCYMKWDHSINVGTCTDKTWRDPTCFQLCPKTSGEFFHRHVASKFAKKKSVMRKEQHFGIVVELIRGFFVSPLSSL